MGKKRQASPHDIGRVTQRQTVADLSEKVTAAQTVVGDEADELIGERTLEYDALIQGAQALIGLLWQSALANRMRKNQPATKQFSTSILILGDLVHKAVALGVRIERERSE